jgi:hypothetical protein
MLPLLFTGKNHSSRDCRKQKLQDRDIAMIRAASDLWKTKGSRNLRRTGVHTVRMNFHLPVYEQTSPDQVCSALLFGFTSTKIADNQI